MPSYAENRKAKFDYEVLETFEGGLVLSGAEAKSIREGGAKLEGAFLHVVRGELWLKGARISRYSKTGRADGYDPERSRKVLVHNKELERLAGKTQQKGLTLVPFSFYPSDRRIKLSFALCRGRKAPDKREKIKKREVERQSMRFLRGRDE